MRVCVCAESRVHHEGAQSSLCSISSSSIRHQFLSNSSATPHQFLSNYSAITQQFLINSSSSIPPHQLTPHQFLINSSSIPQQFLSNSSSFLANSSRIPHQFLPSIPRTSLPQCVQGCGEYSESSAYARTDSQKANSTVRVHEYTDNS
jgi:hypothetical protein